MVRPDIIMYALLKRLKILVMQNKCESVTEKQDKGTISNYTRLKKVLPTPALLHFFFLTLSVKFIIVLSQVAEYSMHGNIKLLSPRTPLLRSPPPATPTSSPPIKTYLSLINC